MQVRGRDRDIFLLEGRLPALEEPLNGQWRAYKPHLHHSLFGTEVTFISGMSTRQYLLIAEAQLMLVERTGIFT